MTFHHLDFEFAIDDTWWHDAGMVDFLPAEKAYLASAPERGFGRDNLPLFNVRVEDVAPLRRQLSHGLFNDDSAETKMTAEQRVGRVLKGFRRGDPIPPVEVVRRFHPDQVSRSSSRMAPTGSTAR